MILFLDIKIHFALREPHSRLIRAKDASKLLVVTYAWDGNTLPGLNITYFIICSSKYIYVSADMNFNVLFNNLVLLTKGNSNIFINIFGIMMSFLQGMNSG